MADPNEIKSKMLERISKLSQLHQKRNNCRNQNYNEVKKELDRQSLPKNWEIREKKAEWLIKDKRERQAVEELGLDYKRVKMLGTSALEQEKHEKLKKNRKIGDQGFADYAAQTARQYQRLIKSMPQKNLQQYNEVKRMQGDDFFSSNPILEGKSEDSKNAIDKMAQDIEGQIEKRKNFSRRRMHNEEADIDYINEKNARLNKKLDRFYGEYTKEIKQNLERGTAI